MYQQGGTIKELLDRIHTNDYVLPAIQREFVWSQEQICRLFDSVMQGYPFGDFLFWKIERENSADYSYYGFVQDYHQRDNPHCPKLGVLPNRRITAVLDGQQRMTAFNIGLRGSIATKIPYKHWTSPDAFPKKVLALDLLENAKPHDEGNVYGFAFVEERNIGRNNDNLWFQVKDIMLLSEPPDVFDWLAKFELEKDRSKNAFRILNRLHQVVHIHPIMAYYEEKRQDIEHVLRIFIRCNSGGTTLSYSDLLLSIATSQWKTRDAREEVHRLVDDCNNGIEPGLGLTKDFVLKAGLMLTDIANVGFQVRNFTYQNMAVLEDEWDNIRNALLETVQVVTGFGFDSTNIRATSALLPIAYYLYKIGSPENFDDHSKYSNDRDTIKGWLIRSILKASGIWGSGLDTLLTELRNCIREKYTTGFPALTLQKIMAQRGKSLEFSEEEIEDLSDLDFSDRRMFALLCILFPFIDLKNNIFHIDHIFPKSCFTEHRLRRVHDIDEELIPQFISCSNRIGNLQLLAGGPNRQKRDKLPEVWLNERFKCDSERRHYCEQHLLDNVPKDFTKFLEFFEARRNRLHIRITELVNTY